MSTVDEKNVSSPTNTEVSNGNTYGLQVVNSEKDDMNLIYLDKDTTLECMSIPTHSGLEYRMVVFVMLWARRNGIKYEFDSNGNIYLTKGVLGEGEYYPCVTSHLDTVQTKHDPYIYAGVPLELLVEKDKSGNHVLSVLGGDIGIGADDKSGIAICLNMFAYHDKLKACFFLDEERGCCGSKKLWKEWFEDVGYVIGYDSPDLFRAAWSCSGTKLFSYKFYEKYMKEVCDKWGLVEGCFFSEPYTDVKEIREQTEIICMNFGNGGYNAHNIGGTEFCVLEDMDHALGMGVDLINFIGLTRHTLKNKSKYDPIVIPFRRQDGFYGKRQVEDDTEKLEKLGDSKKTHYAHYNTTSYSKKESDVKFENVEYITRRYDKHIAQIENELSEKISALCEKHGIDSSEFIEALTNSFNNEITF